MGESLRDGELFVAFILDSLPDDNLPEELAGVTVDRLRFDPLTESPDWMRTTFNVDPPNHWYDPGGKALSVRVAANNPQEAIRAAWVKALPAARVLAAYVPYPLGWNRASVPKVILPTGVVLVANRTGWNLHQYQTWLAINMSTDPVRDWRRHREPFDRIARASNVYMALPTPSEDRVRIERALHWFELFRQTGNYATRLIQGWHAWLPLVILRSHDSGVVINRLQALAKRHGVTGLGGALGQIRDARDEIAHEAAMADADPMAVDSKIATLHLHLMHKLFLMALLFVLEAEPVKASIQEKWKGVRKYAPSLTITDDMVPLWLTVPEIFS